MGDSCYQPDLVQRLDRKGHYVFHQAVADMDGVIDIAAGECTEGTGISFEESFEKPPLLIRLANTNEVFALVNRSGTSSCGIVDATQPVYHFLGDTPVFFRTSTMLRI